MLMSACNADEVVALLNACPMSDFWKFQIRDDERGKKNEFAVDSEKAYGVMREISRVLIIVFLSSALMPVNAGHSSPCALLNILLVSLPVKQLCSLGKSGKGGKHRNIRVLLISPNANRVVRWTR